MANTALPGILAFTGLDIALPARTPGCLGVNDAADPRALARLGDTPGCAGVRDHGDPTLPWWNPIRPRAFGPVRTVDGVALAPSMTAPPLPSRAISPPWMAIAEEEARRFEGHDEAIIEKTTNYATAVGTGQTTLVGNDHPWCAAFVNWCLQKAGVPIDNPSFPDHTYAKGRAHGFYEVKGPQGSKGPSMVQNPLFVKLDAPVFGAIAVVTNASGHGEHVGFVYSRPADNFLVLLGGNQGNTIRFAKFNIAAGKGAKEHLMFFFPSGDKWLPENSSTLDDVTDVVLNKRFGIAISRNAQQNTTR